MLTIKYFKSSPLNNEISILLNLFFSICHTYLSLLQFFFKFLNMSPLLYCQFPNFILTHTFFIFNEFQSPHKILLFTYYWTLFVKTNGIQNYLIFTFIAFSFCRFDYNHILRVWLIRGRGYDSSRLKRNSRLLKSLEFNYNLTHPLSSDIKNLDFVLLDKVNQIVCLLYGLETKLLQRYLFILECDAIIIFFGILFFCIEYDKFLCLIHFSFFRLFFK